MNSTSKARSRCNSQCPCRLQTCLRRWWSGKGGFPSLGQGTSGFLHMPRSRVIREKSVMVSVGRNPVGWASGEILKIKILLITARLLLVFLQGPVSSWWSVTMLSASCVLQSFQISTFVFSAACTWPLNRVTMRTTLITLTGLNAQRLDRYPSDHNSYTVIFSLRNPEPGLRDHEACAYSSRFAFSVMQSTLRSLSHRADPTGKTAFAPTMFTRIRYRSWRYWFSSDGIGCR